MARIILLATKKKTNTQLISSDNIFGAMEQILKQLKLDGQIDFAFLSEEVDKSKYYSELLKEYIFEEIRQLEFPDKPSRRKCIFFAPKEVDILEYGKTMNFDMSQKKLLEIEVSDINKVHFTDMRLLNCNSQSHEDKVNHALKYWEGTDEREDFVEVLYEGNFKIIKVDN